MSKHRCSIVSFEACLAVGRQLPWAEGPRMYSSPAVGEMELSGFFTCSRCPPGAVECHGESAPGCVCTKRRRPLPSRSSASHWRGPPVTGGPSSELHPPQLPGTGSGHVQGAHEEVWGKKSLGNAWGVSAAGTGIRGDRLPGTECRNAFPGDRK